MKDQTGTNRENPERITFSGMNPIPLLGSLAKDDDRDCLQDDPEVEQKGGSVYVLDVEHHPLLEATDGVPAADLPETGQSGFHA